MARHVEERAQQRHIGSGQRLAQWALAGIGALIAGRLVRADVPIELAIVAEYLDLLAKALA